MKQVMKKSLCLLLAVICILAAGCSANGNGQKGSKLKVENCVVTTDLYEFSYPEGLVDVIRVAEVEGTVNLEFYAAMTNGEQKIFDMKYDNTSGNFTVEFEKSGGKKIPVSFVMYGVPENLSESDKMTFYAAQEAVNDIVASLVLK